MPPRRTSVPSVTRKDASHLTLGKRPDVHGRVVAGCGEARVVRQKTETTHCFSIPGSCREVLHVVLETLGDSRLICRRDVGTGVVGGQRADGGIARS
jgi:hypothetical protein